jgi:hypothetical protein
VNNGERLPCCARVLSLQSPPATPAIFRSALRLVSPLGVDPLFLPNAAPGARVRRREAFRIAHWCSGRRPGRRDAGTDALSVAEAVADFNRENSVKLWTITVV